MNKFNYVIRQTGKIHSFLLFFVFSFFFSSVIVSQTKPCEIRKNDYVPYLNSLQCYKEFNHLQALPLTSKYSQVKCLKVVYSLKNKKVYYINSRLYHFHFDFCSAQLGYTLPLDYFNNDQYGDSENRQFVLANLNYFSSGNKYTLEFFADDKVKVNDIIPFYEELKRSCYFGEQLELLVNSEEIMNKSTALKNKVPLIYPEDIYKLQKYQALNKAEAYGYVHRINDYNAEKKSIKEHDILVVKNVPPDIPLISGIITDQFQTPLCHINVLSHNRKTPNATFKGVWGSTLIDSLEGKLVHYVVKDDLFILEPASKEKAEKFWARKNKATPTITLKLNATQSGLISIKELNAKSVSLVGGKAANMGELSKIKVGDKPLPIPEAAFAIPFYYYIQHIQKNNIVDSINILLDSSGIRTNYELLDKKLKGIRKLIKETPIDSGLIRLIETRIKKTKYSAFRFRSSTNTEDIENFNGAGLYDSKTGIINDSVKTIEKAIKQVWASLWNVRAFQERENFKIDQHSVAMGILVHKSFGVEAANGVAVTKHIYRDDYPAYTINVQKGDVSVVFPPDEVTCDQLIVGTAHFTSAPTTSVDYITRSNIKPYGNVLTPEEIEVLKTYLSAIKLHYYRKTRMTANFEDFSMDVEFKLDAGTRKIVIKQARSYN